jgi:copper transport protein
VLAVLLFLTPRLESLGRERKWLLAVLALLTLIPIALTSHAAAIGTGARAATVADGLHLAAGSVWVGGLLAMATLLVSLRGQPGAQRRAVLGDVIPRFSTLAIASVLLLVASGFYATWLQVGNLTALVETDHGVTLLLKLILVLVMLGLGALNLLILTPRLASAAASGYEFGRTVLSEALLGVVVLLLVGILTSLPTARGEIEASSGRLTRQLSDSGTTAQLIISPGAVGANRYTVDVEPGVELPPSSALFLRLRSSGGELTGLSEIELQRTGAQRFEASGSELSVVGSWEIEAILRRPDRPDWRSTSAAEIGVEAPHAARPGDAVRFAGSAGGVSMLAALLGVPALAAGLRMPRRRALLIAGGCLLLAGCAGLALTAGYG